jgi:hypothetical protein
MLEIRQDYIVRASTLEGFLTAIGGEGYKDNKKFFGLPIWLFPKKIRQARAEGFRAEIDGLVVGAGFSAKAMKLVDVNYSAFNFDTKTYNCDIYFGEKIYKREDTFLDAKKVFERENPKWELVEIRSRYAMTHVVGYQYHDTFPCPQEPKIGTDGSLNIANQIVVRNKKTNKLVESLLVFHGEVDGLNALSPGTGLYFCAGDVRGEAEFWGELIARGLKYEKRALVRGKKVRVR